MITVVLDPPAEQSRALWRNALSLMSELDGDWTLVGGLMVQLHAFRYGVPSVRLTVDIDILADSRRRPSATERIGATLAKLGFEVSERAQLRDPATAFRFERAGTVVDLLAPEKTGRRRPPKTVGGFQTVEIPGGTQAAAATRIATISSCCSPASMIRSPYEVTSSAPSVTGYEMPTRCSHSAVPICHRASPPTNSTVPAPATGCSSARSHEPLRPVAACRHHRPSGPGRCRRQ